MAGAGEAVGGIAGAVPGTLELPLKIAGEIRAWKEFQAKLHEGGMIDEFPAQSGLLKDQETAIAESIKSTYGLGDDATVSVSFKQEGEGSRIIPFRAPSSKAKFALRLEWEYFYATIEVRAKAGFSVKKDDGTVLRTYKAGEIVHSNPHFGGFVNNVTMQVHNRTHIKSGDYAFTVQGRVEPRTEAAPGQLTHFVDVYFSLNTHTTKKDFKGSGNLGKNPRQFRYSIAGNKSVVYYDEEGKKLEVPRSAPAAGKHFTEEELIALRESAARENQGVLFSLNKGKGMTVDVYAIQAADLKVKTATKKAAPATAKVRGLETILVIGPHSSVLTDYLNEYDTCHVGSLRYSSLRGHGTWTFTGLGAVEAGVKKQVKAQFEHGELQSTKKSIKFA